MQDIFPIFLSYLTLLTRGGVGVIFARGKFKFKLFLNGLWY